MATGTTNEIRIHVRVSRIKKGEDKISNSYSFYSYKDGKAIFDGKNPMETAIIIIEMFPSQSKEIFRFRKLNSSILLPKEVDVRHMEPDAQIALKEAFKECLPQVEKMPTPV